MNASQFRGQKVKGQGHGGIKHFLGLAWRLEKYSSDFHQTYTNDVDVLWDKDECVKFWGQKVTVRGHSGLTYTGTVTAQTYSIRRLISS